MPVGCIQPIHQDNKMVRKIKIENPTRNAKARAMRLFFCSSEPEPRIMKNRAAPKLAKIATNAAITK